MQTHTIHQLEKELKTRAPKEVLEIAIRLAKHKKENKELLSYLLFGGNDEKEYITEVKDKIDVLMTEINRKTTYTTKKGLQKVVRNMTKFIKYSKNKATELEIRIYFCKKIKSARIRLDSSTVINNLFYREIEKIKDLYAKLHDDLQLDYRSDMEELGVGD